MRNNNTIIPDDDHHHHHDDDDDDERFRVERGSKRKMIYECEYNERKREREVSPLIEQHCNETPNRTVTTNWI